MRSRTASDSVRSQDLRSRPSSAERQESGEDFDDGGFSAAVGAEETEDFAFFYAEADVVHGGEAAKRRTRCSAAMAACARDCWWSHSVSFGLSVSHPQHAGKGHDRRDHDANFYANDLVDAFFAGLNIARRNSACWLICSTKPSKAVFGKESTRTSAFWQA